MKYDVTTTRPSPRAGHSLGVTEVTTVDELKVVDRGRLVVDEGSDEALEVVFQPHGLDVALKANDEVVGGNSLITLASLVTPGWMKTKEVLEVNLTGVVVGNESVGLRAVVMVPKLNRVHQVSDVDKSGPSPDDSSIADASLVDVVVVVGAEMASIDP